MTRRFVILMEFRGGVVGLLPADGETGDTRIFEDLEEARRECLPEVLKQTLSNYNDDACDYQVDDLVEASVCELTEVMFVKIGSRGRRRKSVAGSRKGRARNRR